jgi:GPH family glycoside/pentoside/hexuronide:cation symporter
MTPTAQPLSRSLARPGALLFATASMPLAAVTTAIAIYLPRHFASHVGISLAAVGSAFAIVRLLDIWVDLLLGLAMDRTTTPLGRYRAWMLGGVPILLLAVYMLFINPTALSTAGLITWLLVLYLGTSILSLGQSAWAATLVSSYHDRSRLFGLLASLGIVGSLSVFLAPVVLAALGRGDAEAVSTMGWMVIIATPLIVGLVAGATPERIRPRLEARRFRMRDYWDLVSRPTMLRILAADFCLALGPGWLSATVLFFLIDARGYSLAQANILLALSISAGFLGAPLVSRLAVRWSKHRALMVSAVGYTVTLCAILLAPKASLLFAIPIMFMMGFFNAAFAALLRAMTADVSDELRLEQGQERAGLLYAITTLTSKAAGAFSIFLTFTVLDRVGYDATAGAANSPSALRGLELASIAGPVGFVMLGAVCCMGYRLTADRHDEIRRALDAREEAYVEAPILQSMTGEVHVATAPRSRES